MNAILAIVLQVLPLAIQGSLGALQVIEEARRTFATMAAEGREEPTDAEVAAVRAIRERSYGDFFADDEA